MRYKTDNQIDMKRLLLSATLFLLAFCCDAFAQMPLEDYRNRITLSIDMIESLKSGDEDAIEGVYQIKNWLPQTEDMPLDGQTVKINNQWLHTLLDQYKAEKDEGEKKEKLNEASNRLAALRTDIEKRESMTEEPSDAKEEVRNILTRPAYHEKVEDPITKFIRETKQRAWNLLLEILNWAFQALFGTGAQASWLFRTIIFVLIGFALFIAIRLIFRFKRGKQREKKRTILGEEIEEGMTPRDLAQAAEAAARTGDFRSAIRKLYISLLYEMAERQLIELEPNATNHDYMAKLARFSSLATPMRYLTDRFDYTWYGMYPSSQDDYAICLSRYQEAMQGAQSIQPQTA